MVGMKKIAAFIMAGAIVVSGISVPATVRAESIPVRENISDTPASGNIIIGVEGYDYTSAQKELLDMVNEVRKKACDEGDPDPRDTSRKLTSSDYVPIKLGVNCTKAAILRAAEGAVYLGHTRPNGGSCFQIMNHYNSSSGSGGENLAWGSDNASRIQGWIDERAAWIDPSVSGQTGHYESLINPNLKYTGMATFNPTNDNAPYNWACTSGEYASSDTELTSYEEAQNKLVLQKMEVKIDNVTETELSGDSALYVGDKGSMSMLVSVTYSGVRDNTTTGCKVYTPGKWKSTDTSVLTVDEDTGSITAKGVGSAKVSCTVTSGDKSISAEKEVVVLPNGVTVEELVNPETITINTGTKPDMPKTVKALLSNGETINVGVTWEDIPNDYQNSKSYSYYQETTFEVKGTFQSYEVYQPIHVIPQIDYFVLEKDTVTVDCGTKPTYPKATYIYLTNHVYYSNETLSWNDNEAYKNRSGGEYEVEGTFSFNKTKKAKVTLIVNPMAKKSVTVSTDDITVVSGHKPVLPKAHVIWADDEETDEEIAWVEDDDFNNGYNKEAGYTYTVSGSYGGEDYSVKVNVVDCFHKSLTTHEAKAATCEENGNILYYSCDDCGSLFSDDQASTKISPEDTVIDKTGHSFGTAEYTWSETSPVTCIATIACINEGCTKTITEKAKITSVEAKAATCTENGKTRYTAAFTDEHFSAQTKTYEDIEALEHDYDDPEYIWSEDGSSCEARRVCKNDTSHVEKEKAVITSKVKREATCIQKGATEYTATFTNKSFYTQTKVIEGELDTEGGHKWGAWKRTTDPTDESEGEDTRYCLNDPTHYETRTVPVLSHIHNISFVDKVDATCTKGGTSSHYKCNECGHLYADLYGETEILDESILVIPAAHKGGVATCASQAVCEVCGEEYGDVAPDNHVNCSVRNAKGNSCTESGYTGDTYCDDCGKMIKEGVVITASGHTPAEAVNENIIPSTYTEYGHYDKVVHCKDCGIVLSSERITTKPLSPGNTDNSTKPETKETETTVPKATVTETTKTETTEYQTVTGQDKRDVFGDEDIENDDEEDIILKDNTTGASYVVISTDDNTPALAYDSPGKVTGTVIVPDKITVDGESYKVTVISQEAFKGEEALTAVKIGDNIETIEDGAFENCSNLKTVTLGKNVKTIGESAFNGCSKLKEIKIGDKVTSIEECAFKGCTSLKKITIPAKVKKIGDNAFANTKSLKTIVIKSKKLTTKTISSKAFKGIGKKVTIKVPKSKRKAYKKLFVKKGLSKKVKIK